MTIRKCALVAALVAMVASWGSAIRGQGGSPAPILVVLNDSAPNPFGHYLPEILRAEGINTFDVVQLSALDAPTLGAATLVVLAETPLTAPEATLVIDYVTAGGRLVAMRPDAQLHGLFGVTAAAGTTTDGYVLVDQSGPGAGLQNLTLPFKGVSDHYDLAGATSVAGLYTTRTLSAGRPVVVRQARTAAWAFDLARSTAYARQGDPAFAGLDRDGLAGYRTNDPFFGTIDLERVSLPHADVQMRLLSRVIAALMADAAPLPKLWYFPGTTRTLLVPTGDSHTTTASAYADLIAAAEAAGGRITLYLSRFLDLSASPVATWVANGHEVSAHPYFDTAGFEGDFAYGYNQAYTWFASGVPVPPGPTVRHHRLTWSGWVDPVSVMAAAPYNVRMDLTYYSWGPVLNNPTQAAQAHGYVNASGLPMRFVTTSGQVLPVYQQHTALVDEQLLVGGNSQGLTTTQALDVSKQLIDASDAGGYSAITTQFHVDYYQFGEVRPWVDGTLAYAAARQIPMWPAGRWLRFTEARSATAISDIVWTSATGVLSFSVAVPAGADAQTITLPSAFAGRTLSHLTLDAATVAPTLITVNGQPTQFFSVAPLGGGARSAVASYALPASVPTIAVNDVSMIETDAGSTTAGLSVTLSAAATTDVTVVWATSDGTASAGVDYVAAGGTLTFTPGITSLPLSITLNGDTVNEPNETILVTLSNPVGAAFGDASGVVTILDDEPNPTAWTHTSAADFSTCSATSGTRVGSAGDVRLLGTFRDDFDGGILDPRWISGSWVEPPTPYTPAPSGGVLSLGNADGAFIRSATEVAATTVEVRARFNASPYQVIALADDTFTTRYARFSTEGGGTNLWAATNPITGGPILTDLGPIPTGYHSFTIERVPQGASELFRYRIDGAVVANHSVTAGEIPAARYLFLSEAGGATPTLDVDTVEVDPPVASQGSFDSCTIDALLSVVWNQLTWTATTPAGSSVQVRTRSSLDGVTWSTWSAPLTVSGSTVTSPNGRYLQYRLELATADPAAAPIVHDVSVTAIGPAPPAISIGNATAAERPAASAVFTATLSSGSLQTVSVTYAAAGGTATSGTDFTAGTGTITFLPGVTTQTVSVAVLDDALDEDDETFTITLSAPVNATLGGAVGTGTITDDDAPPEVSIAGVTVGEGDTGTAVAAFPLSLSAPSGKTVTVSFATADGTATAGADYAAASGTVTFTPGVVVQNASVNVIGDIVVELAETFTVTLSAPVNASLGTSVATGTITNDDVLPTAVADTYATPFNTPLVVAAPGVLANDSNDGGGAMTAQLVSGVAHGTLTLGGDGRVDYTPTAGYTGVDSFIYRVVDGSGTGNSVTVTLTIGLEPPTPAADAYGTPFETTLTVAAPGVLANDDAHTAPGLSAALVSGVAHGALTLGADGSVSYTPDAGFAGTDSFVYRASSAAGAGGTATVTITVDEPTVVQAPRELRVAALTGAVVTFRWKAPTVGPDPTGYQIEGGVVPSQTLAAVPTGLTAPIFTLAAPRGSFYVRVRALGPGGPSAVSNEILLHVGVPVPPSAPAALTATASGDALHLAWQPTFGGGAATGAQLDVTGSVTASLPLPAGERVSFAGVPAGSYTVAIRGTNAGGNGTASSPLSVSVPGVCSGPPAPPANLLVYTAGGTTFVVWDPPDSGEAPLGYVVSVPGVGAFPVSTRTISGPLSAGTYTIGVQSAGACAMSAATTQTITVP